MNTKKLLYVAYVLAAPLVVYGTTCPGYGNFIGLFLSYGFVGFIVGLFRIPWVILKFQRTSGYLLSFNKRLFLTLLVDFLAFFTLLVGSSLLAIITVGLGSISDSYGPIGALFFYGAAMLGIASYLPTFIVPRGQDFTNAWQKIIKRWILGLTLIGPLTIIGIGLVLGTGSIWLSRASYAQEIIPAPEPPRIISGFDYTCPTQLELFRSHFQEALTSLGIYLILMVIISYAINRILARLKKN